MFRNFRVIIPCVLAFHFQQYLVPFAHATPESTNSIRYSSQFEIAGIAIAENAKSYYLINSGGVWAAAREGSIDNENSEMLGVKISPSNSTIYLMAAPSKKKLGNASGFCRYGVFGTSSRKTSGYTVCSSAFTKPSRMVTDPSDPVNSLVGYTITTVLLGTTDVYVELDVDKLTNAVKSSGLLALIESDRLLKYRTEAKQAESIESIAKWLETYGTTYDPDRLSEVLKQKIMVLQQEKKREIYRQAFENAQSSSSLFDFIENIKISGYDPDVFLPEASKRYQASLAAEDAATKAEVRRQEQMAVADAENKRREALAIQAWRKNIKVGEETNCGPTLDLRNNLVKVYFPVKDYGSEHWIRRDQLLPYGAGCLFINGRYAGAN